MTKTKNLISVSLFSIALSLELAIVPGFLTKVQAQSNSTNQSQVIPDQSVASVTFDPPAGDRPDDTAGGASRGEGCPQESVGVCVVPLMPNTKNGLTIAERPTFFVYVPQTSAKEIFFGLIDENNNNYYQTKIPLDGKSGILRFQLPDNAPALEAGKNYRWTFIIIGDQGLRADSRGVEGNIQRVVANPTLVSQLQNKSLVQQAALYGKNGIWYETLTSLAEARKSNPNDDKLLVTWQNLLNSVGLNAIATKPLID